MRAIKKRRFLLAVVVSFGIFLLLAQTGFQSIPVALGSSAQAINEAGLQRARSQAIAKNALILAYRSDQKERSQAISDLEIILPLFEQEQGVLASYNSAYHLSDIALFVDASRADYLALDTAARSILAHWNQPVDKTQVDIIVAHNVAYLITINQLVIAIQNHIDERDLHLFLLETSINAVLLILALILLLDITRVDRQTKQRT